MKVEYQKTALEELLEILETAFFSGRKIIRITTSMAEWKEILELNANVKFMNSIKSRAYIKEIHTVCQCDAPLAATIRYHVLETPYQQSVLGKQVEVLIV